MKIIPLGEPYVVQDNPDSLHNYFGWPTVARLKNNRLAVASSGFRLQHVCPFGKAVLSFSEDEGKTFTRPAPVIDTVLDDRDAGLCPFGKSGLILTSFNNTTVFQHRSGVDTPYAHEYLNGVPSDMEKAALGSTWRVSFDNGVTFGPLYHCPVTSPHGPVELRDGSILWVGRRFSHDDSMQSDDRVEAWRLHPEDGTSEFVGAVENILVDGIEPLSCEPDTIELPSGRLITHIRMDKIFTTYQSESDDGGKTWTTPHPLLPKMGGAPAHLFMTEDGILFSVYGFRTEPFGLKVMFSTNGGESWETDHRLYTNPWSADLGYPATVKVPDGFLTVFYAHPEKDGPAVILAQRWTYEE